MSEQNDPANPPGNPPVNAPAAKAPELRSFSSDFVESLRTESAHWQQKATGHKGEAEAARRAADEAKAAADAAKAEADQRVAQAVAAGNERLKLAELKAAAVAAGMVDLDGLKLLDTSKVTLDENGSVKLPDNFFESAKESKPWLFKAADPAAPPATSTSSTAKVPPASTPGKQKQYKDMSPEERIEFKRANGIRIR